MEANPVSGQSGDARMPLTSHLEELRSCLIKCAVVVAIAFLITFSFAEKIFYFLTAPLLQLEAEGLRLIGTGLYGDRIIWGQAYRDSLI